MPPPKDPIKYEEWRKNKSLAFSGKNNPLYGKHHSQETIKKMSLTKKGKILTNEHKKNLSLALKGKSTWNKGKHLSEEHKRKISLAKKGHISPMKNKHLSNQSKQKLSLANKGKKRSEEIKIKMRLNHGKGMSGKHHSEASKIKISLKNKGKRIWLGKHHSEASKLKMKKHRMTQILPFKDTSIEIKIQNFLKELGIAFFTHQYMKEIEHGYQCDIFIPTLNLIIECDGMYWHKYPTGRDIDHIRTKELIEKGFKVLRLWEVDIKKIQIDEFEKLIFEVKNE